MLLTFAVVFDLRTRHIPNGLTLTGLLLGLLWHGASGVPGLVFAVEGIGVASVMVIFWMARALGAGDVKLLGAVGALMGPVFLLWTVLGAIFAGGILSLAMVLARGTLKGRMPLAPVIALGALFAALRQQVGLL